MTAPAGDPDEDSEGREGRQPVAGGAVSGLVKRWGGVDCGEMGVEVGDDIGLCGRGGDCGLGGGG